VVVVGVAGAALSVDAGLAVIVLLGLALSASIWWLYFGTGDDARAEHALERLSGVARARAVLFAYFFAYLPMLLGLVLIAAAEHAALVRRLTTLDRKDSL
jgi:low temperature requirement protein LtrA